VNATLHVIGRGVIPLGAVAGGALGDAIGVRPTLLVAAGGIVLGAAWLTRSGIWSVRGRQVVETTFDPGGHEP
jgi:predicted MFS family arabinose efflux permease